MARSFRLFNLPGQRHHPRVMVDFILEFLLEIIRNLFIEELSDHVRRGARRMVRPSGIRNVHLRIHQGNRRVSSTGCSQILSRSCSFPQLFPPCGFSGNC